MAQVRIVDLKLVSRGLQKRGMAKAAATALTYREKLALLLDGETLAPRDAKVSDEQPDDDDDVINLPDIADVSFPTMVGAIKEKGNHPQPKRKRGKPVDYKGESGLEGRPPTLSSPCPLAAVRGLRSRALRRACS